ncbi:MAG: putative signal transduction histidine kinase [Candidatus Peregrinibacteria bacterium Greene0416_19]|nr:MAG: putative signal transduction histidine kinase [Candidatus Peregrinibacteria bacterium Greene0416_19]
MLILFFSAAAVVTITISMYSFTANLLKQRLNQRVLAIISTASLLFSPEEIKELRELGPEASLKTPTYRSVVEKLQQLKRANDRMTFAYIWAPSEKPNIMTFIADADVIALRPSLNYDIDEVTEDGFPGSEYDITGIRVFEDGSVNKGPTVNQEIYKDRWGLLYSGFAPIKDEYNNTIAYLGVDIDVTDYNHLVKATYLPFGIITIILMLILIGLTIAFLRLWGGRIELLRELDRQKDELLGIVSHQLASPITALRWDLESLFDDYLTKIGNDGRKTLEEMKQSTVNLADLVSMILDVSRIQLGKVKIDKKPLELTAFFEEMIHVIEPGAKEKKIIFTSKLPAAFPTANLDRRYTRMTIENLLTNAVKYTPEGGKVNFVVSIRDGHVLCEVRDTGCGIPKKDQEKIFGKLFRASNIQNSVDGNGFGLYVAKGAVESQGGKIWFESEEGKGTTFFVDLPLKDDINHSADEGHGGWVTQLKAAIHL